MAFHDLSSIVQNLINIHFSHDSMSEFDFIQETDLFRNAKFRLIIRIKGLQTDFHVTLNLA